MLLIIMLILNIKFNLFINFYSAILHTFIGISSVFIGFYLALNRKNKKLNPLYIYIYHSNFFYDKIGFIYKENNNLKTHNMSGKSNIDNHNLNLSKNNKDIFKSYINNKKIHFFKLN